MRTPAIAIILGALVLVAGFFVTQVRMVPDVRRIEHPYAIETLRNRDDLNVVLLLIDTLRADRLGAWNYQRATSPYMDELARYGIRFARHRSQSSWTKTSMASLWTGLNPVRAGVLRFDDGLAEDALLPAEIFSRDGYRTAGIWRNGWVAPTFGFAQGFSIYHRPRPEPPRAKARRRQEADPRARVQGSDVDLTRAAAEFLRTHREDRFFLYLHYMDVHQYLSDEESARFGTAYPDLYDNSIHWTDRHVGALVRELEENGVLDRTIIVIASDHGEAFGEHGTEGHAKNLYSEVIHVPWIISLPFVLDEGLVIDVPTSNVDIWPTIFDMIGMNGVDGLDGRSRMPEIRAAAGFGGPDADEGTPPTFAHLDRNWGRTHSKYDPIIAILDEPHKFVHRPSRPGADELYDLETDPGEHRNLAADDGSTELRQRYLGSVEDYLASPVAPWGARVEKVDIDDMQRGQLRALGYVIE